MPLKVLHSLLEEKPHHDESKFIPCIGLSNWALDPAKMNRGVYMRRDSPNLEEIINTARGICGNVEVMVNMVVGLACSYAEVVKKLQPRQRKDYFGLRDFYVLLKMMKLRLPGLTATHIAGQIEYLVRRYCEIFLFTNQIVLLLK
jgi:hypothetical protein